MKKFVLTFLLVLCSVIILPNSIDKLTTNKQVEQFILNQMPVKDRIFELGTLKTIFHLEFVRKKARKFGVKPWFKTDFNDDGLTDLFAYCVYAGNVWITIIIDNGNGFKVHEISIGSYFFDFCFPKIEKIKPNLTSLILYKGFIRGENHYGIKDTIKLIYKDGEFIEPNFNVVNYQIEKIGLKTGLCDGNCKTSCLYIYPDKKVLYFDFEGRDDDIKFGESKYTTLDSACYNEIVDLLNYIDFPNYDKHYYSIADGIQLNYLKITYNNGLTKEIHIWGNGFFGLEILYDKLFAIMNSQNWR